MPPAGIVAVWGSYVDLSGGPPDASPADAALLVQGDLTTGFNCRFSVDFASTRA